MLTFIKNEIKNGNFKTTIFKYWPPRDILIVQGSAPEVLNRLKIRKANPAALYARVVDTEHDETVLPMLGCTDWLEAIFGSQKLKEISVDFCRWCDNESAECKPDKFHGCVNFKTSGTPAL